MENRCFPSCCCYFQKLDRRHYFGQHLVKNEDAQPDFLCIHLDEFRIIYVEGYKTWSFWMILIDTHSWHAFIIFPVIALEFINPRQEMKSFIQAVTALIFHQSSTLIKKTYRIMKIISGKIIPWNIKIILESSMA